jgi:hypothetical protein
MLTMCVTKGLADLARGSAVLTVQHWNYVCVEEVVHLGPFQTRAHP